MTEPDDMISLTGRPGSRVLGTAFVLLISLASSGAPTAPAAQAKAKAQAKAQDNSELDAQLTKVRDQILDLKTRLREEEKKEATILSGLDRINLQRTILKNELDLYTLQMEKAGREQAALKKAIPPLKSKLDREKEAIATTLFTLYKFGRFSFLQFFFQSENIRSFASESKSLTLLAQYQQDVLRSYQTTLAKLTTTQRNLATKKVELAGLIEAAKVKRQELENEEARNKVRIEEIKQNKALYQQTLNELNERAQQLQQLMEKLANQEIVLPVPFVPIYDRKGKLPWPVEGKVITRFGLEKHPVFNTSTKNNGIEIAPESKDVVIKALHAGKVVYADYFQGYGNLLILDHGLSYYSLYGHCAGFLVKKGDWVSAGQPLALVGDVGSLKGTNLYLEIRYKAQPLNPLQWLEHR
jgi:septal ring factor EnvC (AmiA/AmiB activator)